MTATDHATLCKAPIAQMREAIRAGAYRGQTAGFAPGKLQANLAILEGAYADDFLKFCEANPQPCPLVGMSRRGDPRLPMLGDIDIRTDVPSYNVYRDGRLAETVHDISALWTDDMVAFALGCSFTFEHALMAAGIPVWHIANDTTVPMFRSSIETVPAGPFGGKMVVSMRAIQTHQVELAAEISRRFPAAHGAPVYWGDPAGIGIADIARPDWGDPAPMPEGHVPVFWACGVTPQVAIERAKLPICITHKPGHMLVTDVPEDAETTVLPAA